MDSVDVVIIGSGYGGAITAARLAEAGMSVVVLERGERLSSPDFEQSDDPKYIQRVIDFVVTSSNIAFRTGKLVGGASIPMDGAHMRVPQKSFLAQDAGGRPYWPAGFSRAAFDPYYERVEAVLKVRQMSWSDIPKAGGLFAKMLDAAGASCDRARLNYEGCVHCGFCSQGCRFGKKQSLILNYIPLAEEHGAQIVPGAYVSHVEATSPGYLVHFEKDGAPDSIAAPRVIVACGGVHTPALLLRSAATLATLSEHVGEHFNNNGEHAFIGILPPEFDDLERYACYQGMDNAGLMSFEWFEDEGFTLHPGAGLEPAVLGGELEAPNHPVLPSKSWGMEYKRFMERVYPHRIIGFSALGLADSHAAIIKTGSSGKPDLSPRDSASHDEYLDRLEARVFAIGEATGVTLVPAVKRQLAGTTSAHLLSSCRMAESIEDGVVDAHCQVFNNENLYVCDASSVPYALGVNPALTVSAIAEMTAEHIIAKG